MKKVEFSKRYLLLPGVLIIFFFLFLLVYEDIKKQTIEEFNKDQLLLAQTAARGITSFYSDYQADLEFISHLNDIIENKGECKAFLEDFYESHKNHIEAITRVDARGVILYTSPANTSVVGKDISYQKHVHQIITRHEPVISDVFRSAQGFLAIAIHVPVFKGKEYAGSLAMLISIDQLGKIYLGDIRFRGSENVWLLSENGTEIYCKTPGHTGKTYSQNMGKTPAAIKLLELIRYEKSGTAQAAHQEEGQVGSIGFENKYVVFYRAQLLNTYWTILISYQKEEVFLELANLRNRLVLIFLLLFAIISYYFFSLTKVRNIIKEESRRREAERTLLQTEERFKKLSNLTFEGILIHDKGIAVEVNESFARLTGYSRKEMIGKNIIELLVIDEYRDVVYSRQPEEKSSPYEVVLKRKDGSIFPVEIEASNIKYQNQNLRVAAVRDISQRKKAEQELLAAKEKAEESDKLKSAFLTNMSHEIRTPMNGILGFADLLREPGLSNEEQQQFIEIIRKSGNRMLNIINDLVDISKIESGLMEVSYSETNINDQIEFIYNFFQPEAEQKGIALSFRSELSTEDATLVTDREKLYAVLSNLVKNALKYTREGKIELGCKKQGSMLEFSVSDTGIGIPADRQQAIFERFIQGDISDKMALQGAGLGLSISKAYVELLGGEIRVESEVGKGSTFYFTIPFNFPADEQSIDKKPIAAGTEKDYPSNLKILIADDDDSSQMLIITMLQKTGNSIKQARNGLECLEICRNYDDLDLVLMDMQMPEMNGYEATMEIRRFNRKVVIIAQTAFAMTGDKEKALMAGCNDYIAKPIKKQELLGLIRKHFKGR